MRVNKHSIHGISLDAAGLVALADLSTIMERTALTGSSSPLDILLLAPGIHRQQAASEINGGELPITGAMTSGYVFRIENQATVAFLQRIGEPGCLVNVIVAECVQRGSVKERLMDLGIFYGTGSSRFASFLYLAGVLASIAVLILVGALWDFWAFGVLMMLVVLRSRAVLGWKGASEPGVHGDLLVLLSQDRWVRIQGLVDDLKAVTAGQWLRDQTKLESFAGALATLLVYVAAALASNASTVGSLCIACLLLVSVALLGLCNSLTEELCMFGRTLSVEGKPKKYGRRLEMAKELIKEAGREDWAIGMGLILPSQGSQAKEVKV